MLTDIFGTIYKENRWKSKESRSGRGSEVCNTESVRENLPRVLDYIMAKSMLDVSCGDFNWMKLVNLGDVKYMGCDIVESIIAKNNYLYADEMHKFFQADITKDELPNTDLILCRCTLYHLSFENIKSAINNIKKSTRYLLLTTMPKVTKNIDMVDGGYRKLNMNLAPFKMPAPIFYFTDTPNTGEVMALYRAEDIR